MEQMKKDYYDSLELIMKKKEGQAEEKRKEQEDMKERVDEYKKILEEQRLKKILDQIQYNEWQQNLEEIREAQKKKAK